MPVLILTGLNQTNIKSKNRKGKAKHFRYKSLSGQQDTALSYNSALNKDKRTNLCKERRIEIDALKFL